MDSKAIREVFDELFTHLERLETQSAATLQFLKEKKRVTDKQLAPYLEQAGNAANVKWRAARVRIERLLSDEDEGEKKIEKKPEIAQAEQEKSAKKPEEQKQAQTERQTGAQEKVDLKKKEQPAKEQDDKNKVASPELEAAVNRDTKHEPGEKKKANTEQPSGHQPVTSTSEKHEEANHPTEMTQDTVQRDSGKPVDEMKPKDKGKDQEAA